MSGASNVQKLPIAASLNALTAKRVRTQIAQVGKTYPCSVVSVKGSVVTVKFEMNTGTITLPQVTMPVFGPEYIRYPLQVGDKGMAVAADAYLGQMTGLGEGVADFTVRPNLSALVFMPIGNQGWDSVDGNAVVIYGPNGVVLENTARECTFTLTPSAVMMKVPGEVKIDTPSVSVTNNLSVGNGASGTFASATGQIITVQDGIVTNISP